MEHEDPYKNIEDVEELEVELEPRPLWQRMLLRTFQIVIGLAVVAGLIYLSGFKQFFFYRKTSDNIKVEQKESILNAEEIEVPVTANIIRAEGGNKGSSRNKEGIRELIKQSNKIWAQADIKLKLKNTKRVTIKEGNLENFSDSLFKNNKIKEDTINAYFIGNLEGPSGLAYSSTLLVADYTTAHDYLVFAHEVGHVLGLDHTNKPNRLMSTEANGPDLIKKEVKKARENATEVVE